MFLNFIISLNPLTGVGISISPVSLTVCLHEQAVSEVPAVLRMNLWPKTFFLITFFPLLRNYNNVVNLSSSHLF